MNYEYMKAREMEKLEMSRRSAIASVCASMAYCSMVTAIFCKDPKFAAKAGSDSLRWQMNITLAHAGLPIMECSERPDRAP